MELLITRGINITNPTGPGPSDVYVAYEFPYPTEAPQTGQTATIKSINPEFDFSTKLALERKRSAKAALERKKISFEVCQPRLLFKHTSIGKAEIKLTDLLTKCEVNEVIELTGANRKLTGGKIEVSIRLRHPFDKEEVRTVEEKYLIIDDFNPQIAEAPHPTPAEHKKPTPESKSSLAAEKPKAESTSPKPHTSAEKVVPKNTQPAQTQPISEQKSVATHPTPEHKSNASVEEDDEALNPFNIDSVVSNNILEWELEQIQQQMAQHKQPQDELLDRKTQVDLKVQLLVLEVQTGKLTMEAYLDRVKKRMEEEKIIALKCKQKGNMEWAKRWYNRYKIMEKEYTEATAQ